METDIFFRSSKHTNEPRGSSASTKRSSSSTSDRARVSGTNSHHKSAPGWSCPEDSQARTSGSSAKTLAVPSNPISITSKEDFNSEHYNIQKYATQVLSGISNLGIDTPPYLQQALMDQHGNWSTRECSYSTVGGQMDVFAGFQFLDFDTTPQQDQWSLTYAGNVGYTNGDLAGIGAQFHG